MFIKDDQYNCKKRERNFEKVKCTALTVLKVISNYIQAAKVLIQSEVSDLERKVENPLQIINSLIINWLK